MRSSSFDDIPSMSLQQRFVELFQKTHWPTLVSGLAIGMAAMQFLVARTVTHNVDNLTREVAAVSLQVRQLAGSATDVQRTNDLLASLGRQRDELAAARDTIEELRQLRAQIQQESGRLGSSVSVLQQLHKLQVDIAAQAEQAADSLQAVEVVNSLNTRISEMAQNLPAQAANIGDAENALVALGDLKDIILAQADACQLARQQVDDVVGLAAALSTSTADLTQARVAASELVALKDGLVANTGDVAASQQAAEQLVALNNTLADTRQIKLDDAQRNLQALLRVQDELAAQTGTLAASIENLDLMADFQQVLGQQFAKLETMRRQLTDLVLMESTIDRAAKALSPLSALGDLRNLNEDELRTAARVILDRRAAAQSSVRVAEQPGDVFSMPAPESESVFDVREAPEAPETSETPEAPERPAPVPPVE